jgi:hypothetical protein
LDAAGTICYNPGRLTALIGVRDLIIVNTKDALLVAHKSEDQRVKKILERLAETGRPEYL